MGRSTVQQLINKGKGENGYNNAGITSDDKWVDFFNAALNDLADDLNLVETFSIVFNGTTRENDLPADYFSIIELYEANGNPVRERRVYGSASNGFQIGYWILYKGDKYVIDLFKYNAVQTFTGLYQRYALALTSDAAGLAKSPQVPTVGEMALPYYAISKALKNNNQLGQAQEYEKKYEAERLKIRNAASRARGA